MRVIVRKILALSTVVILIGTSSGCVPSQSDQAERRTEAEKQQALRESTFGPLAESMDRARAVEQLQQDRKAELDAAIENSGNR